MLSLERNSTWLPGSNEKDIGLGIDAVGDDEREDEDAEAHCQGDELQGKERCSQIISVQFGVIARGWELASEFWRGLQAPSAEQS